MEMWSAVLSYFINKLRTYVYTYIIVEGGLDSVMESISMHIRSSPNVVQKFGLWTIKCMH